MKHRFPLIIVFVLLLAMFFAVALAGCSSPEADPGTPPAGNENGENENGSAAGNGQLKPVNYRMATFNLGTSTYVIGIALGEMMESILPSGSRVEILPHAGQVGNPSLIHSGEAEFGLGYTLSNAWAYEGELLYDTKMEDLRGVAGGFGRYFVTIISTERSGINSLKEVIDNKQKVTILTDPPGAMGQVVAEHILQAYGAGYEEVNAWGGKIEHVHQDVAVQKLQDGDAEIWIKLATVGHPKVGELAATTKIKFLDVEADVLKKLETDFNYETNIQLPSGAFVNQDYEVDSVSFVNVLITSKDLPEEIIYEITKAICENKPKLVQAHASFEDFVPEVAGTLQRVGIPLHDGAAKYFQEKGYDFN